MVFHRHNGFWEESRDMQAIWPMFMSSTTLSHNPRSLLIPHLKLGSNCVMKPHARSLRNMPEMSGEEQLLGETVP
jgi:hypothetical protein